MMGFMPMKSFSDPQEVDKVFRTWKNEELIRD